MRCPFCGDLKNRVVDSRMAREGRSIRRRRHCEACEERFTTYEIVEDTMADVEKRAGQTEPFDAEKLIRSVRLACKKRPIPLPKITAFAERLEAQVSARSGRTISSQELGDEVMAFLRASDPVAYVRYASVYRSFSTIEEFMGALESFEPFQLTAPGIGPAQK